MYTTDYLVVGAGLTGSVIARLLRDAGLTVLVAERRAQCAGNIRDSVHGCGLLINEYGPHYFRTSSAKIWAFVQRFAAFYEYHAVVKSMISSGLEAWPVSSEYVARTCGDRWRPTFTGSPTNFEEACLARMPRGVYYEFVKEYTEKQWGRCASSLSANLAKRVRVGENNDPRLTPNAIFQGIPQCGYSAMIDNMLDGIEVVREFDYLTRKHEMCVLKKVVYTGPIDELFGFRFGRLEYRGQIRKHTYYEDKQFVQECAQINNPRRANGAHIRTIEWKHMAVARGESVNGTVITEETPYSANDPDCYEYPVPDVRNTRLLMEYKRLSERRRDVIVCGRLGEYRYLDMDQAIARAGIVANRILVGEGIRWKNPLV